MLLATLGRDHRQFPSLNTGHNFIKKLFDASAIFGGDLKVFVLF